MACYLFWGPAVELLPVIFLLSIFMVFVKLACKYPNTLVARTNIILHLFIGSQ